MLSEVTTRWLEKRALTVLNKQRCLCSPSCATDRKFEEEDKLTSVTIYSDRTESDGTLEDDTHVMFQWQIITCIQ